MEIVLMGCRVLLESFGNLTRDERRSTLPEADALSPGAQSSGCTIHILETSAPARFREASVRWFDKKVKLWIAFFS
jgi:hypothetical protein